MSKLPLGKWVSNVKRVLKFFVKRTGAFDEKIINI